MGTAAAPDVPDRSLTGPVPAHLPRRLAICLWDFSWYTRAGAGEPYEDVARAMEETAALGYNAVRICAAPILVTGSLGLGDLAANLPVDGLGTAPDGGVYGRRTRWYDAAGDYRIDVRARLFELLHAARRAGVVVILSSWEYQQSPAFAADARWYEALHGVPLEERHDALAAAWGRLLTEIGERGLLGTVAFVELHNEVDFSMLPGLEPRGEAALRELREKHPGVLVTASYGKPPHLAMHTLSAELGVAQCHVYSYGVLDALQRRIDIRSEGTQGFPNAELAALLRQDAPTFAEYGRPKAWKLAATVVTDQMVYGYDWIDPQAWDRWLYEHYGQYRELMRREINSRVVAVAAWARWRQIPAVIGEGWVGYTPRDSWFEEGPIGLDLAELGARTALEHGVWGVVPCSNTAPHHPMWQLTKWQRHVNTLVRTETYGWHVG